MKPFDPVAVGPTGVGLRDPKSLTSSEGRRVALPAVIAAHQLEPLRPLATSGEGRGEAGRLGRAGPHGR